MRFFFFSIIFAHLLVTSHNVCLCVCICVDMLTYCCIHIKGEAILTEPVCALYNLISHDYSQDFSSILFSNYQDLVSTVRSVFMV